MTIGLTNLHAALRAAGVPEDKANEAAEEVACLGGDARIWREINLLKIWLGISLVLNTLLIFGVFK